MISALVLYDSEDEESKKSIFTREKEPRNRETDMQTKGTGDKITRRINNRFSYRAILLQYSGVARFLRARNTDRIASDDLIWSLINCSTLRH